MITAMARYIDQCPEAKRYYDKKRSEGKKHNQALRSLARHMVRVIWSMLRDGRDYEIREDESSQKVAIEQNQNQVTKVDTTFIEPTDKPPEIVLEEQIIA